MIIPVPSEIIDFLHKYSTFFVIGHEEPDGDCLGSQKALASILNRTGKKAILCSPGPFTRPETKKIEPLFAKSIAETDAWAEIKEGSESAAAIVVDCSTPERIGETFTVEIKALPTAVIDHHASGQPFGDVSFVNGDSPSTTIMIYQIFKELGLEPTEAEAEDMMFGFLTDTGYFRHLDSSNSGSMRLAAELLDYGISLKDLYFRMYGGRELASKILTGRVLSRAVPLFEGRCILIHETLEEKQTYGANNRDSDTIYSQLLAVKNCEAVIFIREETENSCSVSLRSRSDIDVGKIAAAFGGGGHMRAAGLEWKGSREEITQKMKDVFSGVFENNK